MLTDSGGKIDDCASYAIAEPLTYLYEAVVVLVDVAVKCSTHDVSAPVMVFDSKRLGDVKHFAFVASFLQISS